MPSPILQAPAARRFEDMAFLDNTNTNQKNAWHFIKTHPKTMYGLVAGLTVTAGAVTGVCLKVPAAKEFMDNVGTEIGQFASTYEGQVAIAGIILGAATLGLSLHQEVTAYFDSKNSQLAAITKFAKNIEISEAGDRVRLKANGPYGTQTAYHTLGAALPFNKVTFSDLCQKVSRPHHTDVEPGKLPIKDATIKELQHQIDIVQLRKLILGAAMLAASGGLLGAVVGAFNTGSSLAGNAGIGTVAGLAAGFGFLYLGIKALPELRNKVAVNVAPMQQARARQFFSRSAASQSELQTHHSQDNNSDFQPYSHQDDSVPLVTEQLPRTPESTYHPYRYQRNNSDQSGRFTPNPRVQNLDPVRSQVYENVFSSHQ